MNRTVLKIVAVGLCMTLSMMVQSCLAQGQTDAAPSSSRPPAKEREDAARIDRLIRQLGSREFAEREAASKALDAIGEPALPALWKAQEVSDLEVRHRVAALLKSIRQKRMLARAKAVAAIEERYGKFGFRESTFGTDGTPNTEITCMDFHCRPVKDADIAMLPLFNEALCVVLTAAQISDDGLAHLETFYRLRVLQLGDSTISDAGLKHIRGLTTITCLELCGTQISDVGLVYLKKLDRLASLDLRYTRITDAGLDHLKECKNLGWLNLSHTKVTDAGLAKLKGLKKLQNLDLTDTQITDAGLAHLKEVPALTLVRLNGTKTTERGKAEWFKEEERREKAKVSKQGFKPK